MIKKRITLFLFCFALFLEFVTTEYALSLGTIGNKKFSELNPLFYRLGKTVFWTLFFGLSALILAGFLYVENLVKRGYILTWAYLLMWGYTAVRLGLGIWNIWQLLK